VTQRGLIHTVTALTEIHSYPLKSAGGIAHTELGLDDRGLLGDRRWMLIGPDNVFLSQRILPRMALIIVEGGVQELRCAAPGMPPLGVVAPFGGRTIAARVWNDVVEVAECGEEVQGWFSDFLGQSCRLVYQPANSLRPVDSHFSLPGTPVNLADAFPLLLIGQGSLDDLNSRLHVPVEMIRFRPNLVVHGSQPFAEDGWRRICIGEVEFTVAKPCARCSIPSVDPLTGTMGREPLLTLAKYRCHENQIFFGQNLLHRNGGVLRVGDEVTVLA
jgi:uncharacterized protein